MWIPQMLKILQDKDWLHMEPSLPWLPYLASSSGMVFLGIVPQGLEGYFRIVIATREI